MARELPVRSVPKTGLRPAGSPWDDTHPPLGFRRGVGLFPLKPSALAAAASEPILLGNGTTGGGSTASTKVSSVDPSAPEPFRDHFLLVVSLGGNSRPQATARKRPS